MDLPRGTVTYLFTDVQGSTRLWEQAPELMMTALEMHDRIIDRAAVENGGVSVKPRGEGDSHFLVFTSASDAVNAAADIQRRLDATDWPTLKPLQVRIALHTGVAEVRSGDYYGTAVNRAARLRAIAHGSQTVASAATWELIKDSLPAGITVTDLGRHGLKDLSRPEHVFQIDVDGLVNDFPALKSLEATPNNLPVQLTALVGREREIADVEQALNRDRFITILAPGGTGKTRLAIETAARLVSEFPDGVFFVDLAPISSTDGIAQAIFESIGVRLAAGDDMRAQLLVYLAGKSQLLVLDNFEHLIAGVDIVTDMLGAAPNIKIIVTSRERLRVSGETVLTLTGLDATWGSEEEALETGSVQLFVEAARRTDQAFALNVEDMESLGRIVRLVEGMPLGIILAAAWVDTLGVGEIAHQIANTLDFLESDRRDTPDRHKSMRAVFDYSLALLPEEERNTLLTLSIFRGGFDAEAAQSVTGATLRTLADLASKSLLTANRDTGRYAIHELLRQYAEEFLLGVDAIRGQTVDAYVGYYSDMAAAAERTIVSGRQVEAMTTMEDDIENFRAAWRRSLEGGDARAARRFVLALWCLYEVRGWHQAADSLFSQALVELPETDTDEATIIAREAARGVLGKFVTYLGNPKAGAEMSAIAADRLATTTDRFAELMSLEAWCDGLAYLGAWTEIREVAIKAIDLAESSGATWWRAGMPNWLGIAESQLGNFESAEAAIEDGNARLTELDDQFFMAWNVMVRATMAAMSGQLDVAATSNQKLVELSRSLGFQRTLQFGLQGLGDAKAAAGDHEQALGAFLECLAASYEMGAVVEVAGLMTRIAVVHVEMGRHEKAIEILASVLADPVRDQKMINETESIDTMATRAMASAEDQLDSDAAESARTKGANTPLSEAARSLLEVLHGEIEPNGGTRTRQLTA